MADSQHPTVNTERAEEETKLAAVVRYIQDALADIDAHQPVTAATQETANALQAILEEEGSNLASALEQPYFGRLDYIPLDGPHSGSDIVDGRPERMHIYIGFKHIPNQDVYSWTAPVARLWYTNEPGFPLPQNHRTHPGMFIRVRVDLKRFLRIRNQRLVGMNDVYRRALPTGTVYGSLGTGNQGALTETLSQAGSQDGLQVIIETIEPHQYEAIANTSDRVLIVQGAAGSGKSEIGIHRIAYLLSPFNDLPPRERPTPDTTLFIGPSKSFLEYTADLLPLLGIEDRVSQVTFRDWANSLRSSNLQIQSRVWNNLLDKGEMTLYSERAEAFKGSLGMAELLERHVGRLFNQIKWRCKMVLASREGMRLEGIPPVSREEVAAALSAAFSDVDKRYRLNERRQSFITHIARLVQVKRSTSRRQLGFDLEEEIPFAELQRRREIERQISDWCDGAWRRIDVRREYVSLLTDHEAVRRLARDRVSEEDADAMAESARKAFSDGFLDSDEGALAYLDHLLNGTVQPQYRHIVIDEAQDVSPIEFKLLGMASTNNWFTIMGDTAQRLTPYRGIQRWSEAGRVFGKDETKVEQALLSYRSNRRITTFNNRVLRLYDKSLDAPKPYDRDGHWPEYHRHASVSDMYLAIIDDLARIREKDGLANASIAILARDRRTMTDFQKVCEEQDFDDIVVFGQERHHGTGTVLARIPDVRGLEYDAVIVLGVNEAFRGTTFNQRLLYVAASRAKHYLALHWAGKQSPILSAISGVGVRYFDRSRGDDSGGVSAAGLRR